MKDLIGYLAVYSKEYFKLYGEINNPKRTEHVVDTFNGYRKMDMSKSLSLWLTVNKLSNEVRTEVMSKALYGIDESHDVYDLKAMFEDMPELDLTFVEDNDFSATVRKMSAWCRDINCDWCRDAHKDEEMDVRCENCNVHWSWKGTHCKKCVAKTASESDNPYSEGK